MAASERARGLVAGVAIMAARVEAAERDGGDVNEADRWAASHQDALLAYVADLEACVEKVRAIPESIINTAFPEIGVCLAALDRPEDEAK